MPESKIHIRLDRAVPAIIPVVGDVLRTRTARWKVVSRELKVVDDNVNDDLWVWVVELGLEPLQ